jgi:putative flippase GtrA
MASRESSGLHRDRTLARDIALALSIGFLTGALAIPVVINLGLGTTIRVPILLLPVIGGALFAIALFAASLVASRVPSFFEFSKFAVVGVLNSGVDFGILNLLMLITGLSSGAAFLAFKSISVTTGVINSYLWNKYWTFNTSNSAADARREFMAFMVVTLIAVGVNVAGADVIVNVIGPPVGFSTKLWANIGAISGAGLTLFTNFFGYKFFVFKKPPVAALEIP